MTENFWNCDGKFQFVTEIMTESTPSQFHSSQINLWRKLWRTKVRHNFLWRKYSVTKICDGNCDRLFPSQKNLWRKLWRKVRHNFQRWKCPGGGKLWRKIVTEFRQIFNFWRNSVTISVRNCERELKKSHHLEYFSVRRILTTTTGKKEGYNVTIINQIHIIYIK